MSKADLVGIRGDGALRLTVTDLPNEILINILQFCHGADILNIAEAFTGSKLDSVIKDPVLWNTAVIGPGDVKKYIKYLGSFTSSLTIIGAISKPRPKQSGGPMLSESVISSISLRCSKLEQFTIKHCIIDNHAVRFSLFPKSITDLTLDNVAIVNGSTVGFVLTIIMYFLKLFLFQDEVCSKIFPILLHQEIPSKAEASFTDRPLLLPDVLRQVDILMDMISFNV